MQPSTRPFSYYLGFIPLAHRAVMGPLWLYAATLGTLEDDLSLFETHPLDVLASGVSLRHCSGIGQHCPQMGAHGQEGQALEDDPIHDGIDLVGVGDQDEADHDILSVQEEHPREEGTEHATDVLHAPEPSVAAPAVQIGLIRNLN